MYIAVATENGKISEHFGKTDEFLVLEAEQERVISRKRIYKHNMKDLNHTDFLKTNKIDMVICNSIGSGAKIALVKKRIDFICGVEGDSMESVIDYLSGRKIGNPRKVCLNYRQNGIDGCDCGCGEK